MSRKLDVTAFDVATMSQLRAELDSRGWSVRYLAQLTGIGQTRLNETFRGNRPLYLGELKKICSTLGVSTPNILRAAEAALEHEGSSSDYSPLPVESSSVDSPSSVSEGSPSEVLARVARLEEQMELFRMGFLMGSQAGVAPLSPSPEGDYAAVVARREASVLREDFSAAASVMRNDN